MYGLKGKHEFLFKPGLNFLLCSNAKGSSSTVRALALLVGETCLGGAIHQAADNAAVRLHAEGGVDYYVRLKRASGSPAVTEAQLLDPQALGAVIVNERHPLHEHLDSEAVRHFVTTASNLSQLKESRDKLEQVCTTKRSQLTKVDAAIKGLGNVESEYRKVKIRIQELDEKYAALRRLPKEEIVPEAQQEALKHLQSKVLKCRENVNEFQKAIRQRAQVLARAEAELVELEAHGDVAKMEERIEAVELEKNKLDQEKEGYKKLVTLAAALQALGYHRKCPACAIFRIHSDWSKISENTYGPTLENYQSGRVVERDRLKRKVDDCVRRLRDLHNLSRGVEDDIALKKSECRECRSELNTLNEHLKDARRRYVTANTEWRGLLKLMGKEATLHGKMHDAKHELDLLEEQLNGFEAPIEELRNARATQAKVKSELEAAEEEFKKREAALVEALDSARGFFNKTAKALLLELGLKGFQEVTIDENFQIRVVREDCVQEAIELSSSESATLTILLALAAKRAYFPTVPFFAVDTITTSYNLTAHRRLMEFLGRELREHVVVTMLAPKEHELKVVHTIPALVTES